MILLGLLLILTLIIVAIQAACISVLLNRQSRPWWLVCCRFNGKPPLGFKSWDAWFNGVLETRRLYGVEVKSLDGEQP